MEIHHREFMVRSVVSNPETTHEDYAIISFNPLPAHAMQFGLVSDVIHEFLEDHMRVAVRDVQPSHLGQGLVRFVHIFDRDMLINTNPHQYGDVQINLVRHDQGRNWRDLNFNVECWIMLMGFPLDYWNSANI
jgi:hypothetical protein